MDGRRRFRARVRRQAGALAPTPPGAREGWAHAAGVGGWVVRRGFRCRGLAGIAADAGVAASGIISWVRVTPALMMVVEFPPAHHSPNWGGYRQRAGQPVVPNAKHEVVRR